MGHPLHQCRHKVVESVCGANICGTDAVILQIVQLVVEIQSGVLCNLTFYWPRQRTETDHSWARCRLNCNTQAGYLS